MNFKQLKIAACVGIIFCSASLWGAEGDNRGNPWAQLYRRAPHNQPNPDAVLLPIRQIPGENHRNNRQHKINTCRDCIFASCIVGTVCVCGYYLIPPALDGSCIAGIGIIALLEAERQLVRR